MILIMTSISRERSRLRIVDGSQERRFGNNLEVRYSVLGKLRPLFESGISGSAYIASLIGERPQLDMENPGEFRDEDTAKFNDFLNERNIIGDEAQVVESVIRKLAYPWQAGQPTGNNFVTVEQAAEWVITGQFKELDGFWGVDSDSVFNVSIAKILFPGG